MVYIFYNSVTGAVLGAYDESCLPDIPTPNIQVEDSVWRTVVLENRECHVDVTQDPPVLVVGDVKPDPVQADRYSKLKIIRKAKEIDALASDGEETNLWDALKAFIQERGAEDEWLAATYLKADDPLFTELVAEIGRQFPGFDIAGFLEDCKY